MLNRSVYDLAGGEKTFRLLVERFYANVAILPHDDKSVFIRAILNRPASTLVTLLSPIADLMKAVDEGRIHEYQDVFSIANY